MRQNSRLSDVLHVLLHMLDAKGPMTSHHIGMMLQTDPVVVRRLMAGLRDAGFVSSVKGHGGGWTVSCDPASITLDDIYKALGSPAFFAMGNRSENPECLVEQCVKDALDIELRKAEAMLLAHFRRVTLASLSADFSRKISSYEQIKEGGKISWKRKM